MIVRPCTRADFEAFFCKKPPMTLRALVAERDGEIVGIGGYYIVGGIAYAFTDQRGMTRREMVRAAHSFMKFIHRIKTDVIAQCNSETGDTVLRHFNFRSYHDDVWRLTI